MNPIYILFLLVFITFSMVSSAQTMTLEECKKQALENNISLKISAEQINQSGYLKKAAYSQFLPSLGFSGSYIRMNKPFQLFEDDFIMPVLPADFYDPSTGNINSNILYSPSMMPLAFVMNPETGLPVADVNGNPVFLQYAWLPSDQLSFGQKNNYLLNVGITQPIYAGGKIRQLYKMSQIAEDMSKKTYTLEQEQILIEIEELYWTLITLKEKLKLANNYNQLIFRIIYDIENYRHEGVVTDNELLKAQIEQNKCNLNLMKLENGIRLTRKAICQKMGIPLDMYFEPADTAIPSEIFVITTQELSNSALQNRIELQMLENSMLIAESGVKMMRSRFLPDIGFTANYSYINPNPYAGFTNTFGGDYNLGIMMHVPIFHWNERRHTLAVARSQHLIAGLQYENAQQMIRLQAEISVNQLNEAWMELESTENSLRFAENNLSILTDKYEEGLCKISDLLEAQVLWQEAYTAHIDAKAEYRKKIMLTKQAGGLNQHN